MASDVISLRRTRDDVYVMALVPEEGDDGTAAVILARRVGWDVDVAYLTPATDLPLYVVRGTYVPVVRFVCFFAKEGSLLGGDFDSSN